SVSLPLCRFQSHRRPHEKRGDASRNAPPEQEPPRMPDRSEEKNRRLQGFPAMPVFGAWSRYTSALRQACLIPNGCGGRAPVIHVARRVSRRPMMDMMEHYKKLAILVGGGPAPGINAVIGAATIRAVLEGMDVVGVRDGFEWLMQGNVDHVTPLTIDAVSRIHF